MKRSVSKLLVKTSLEIMVMEVKVSGWIGKFLKAK